ncbi:MAG: hypothetical protein U0441_17190 [Polyangiaceae bacterium]
MCTAWVTPSAFDLPEELASSDTTALSMLKAHLADVCTTAGAVVVADYEGGDLARVDELVKRAHSLLSSALEAIDVVAVLCGGVDDDLPPEQEGDRPALSPEDAETIGGVVVLARMDLRGRRRALDLLSERSSAVDRLAAAGSALRAIQKSLSAIDDAVSTGAQVPRSINFYGQTLARSLDTRKRYLRFQNIVVRDGPPNAEALPARLRSIGNAIAQILGAHVALHLRTGDRALLMVSHARIHEWLTARDHGPTHVATGLRLWQDVVNIATMFLEVNKREELILHDGRVVREALRALPPEGDEWGEAAWDDAARAAVLDKLKPARGRAAALDAMVDGPPSEIRLPALRALLVELDRALAIAAPDGV